LRGVSARGRKLQTFCAAFPPAGGSSKLFARRFRPWAKPIILLIGGLLLFGAGLWAQDVSIHSHNDYRQTVPFYQAYAQQAASIEADVYAWGEGDNLLVAHDPQELPAAPSLREAYIEPLAALFKQNKGRAWKNSDKKLTLLIDLKTPPVPTLDQVVALLEQHPEVFDPQVNPYAVRVVISGEAPRPEAFGSYPSFVSFDGSRLDYTPAQLERIAMISLDFSRYSRWNGKGSMLPAEYRQVCEAIDAAHALDKPIRFWGAPDGVTAWNTFHNIGVDYINTDRPEACAAFFRDFHRKNYRIDAHNERLTGDLARAKRLDKATAGFQGFSNRELQLTEGVAVYHPTYRNDGAETPVRNVIFLIGDGMGLAQVCAADAVNGALSILQLQHLGMQRTQAADAYTTDSAGAGSSLASGRKNKNRHICMGDEGEIYPSLTDVFHDNGYACGVVTLGDLADATPAAFYGHAVERDDTDAITACLLDGKLTLLSGSGMNNLTRRKDGRDLAKELTAQAKYTIQTSVDDINRTPGKVVCVDERMGKAATQQTLGLLAGATREAISKLTAEKQKGFFLMVEGAKIDYAGHANSLPGSVMETLSFDLAVAEALKFADSNGETLVIVTGDHETGGLTLVDGNSETGLITAQYMTDDHTPIMLPVYAYGPFARKFTGVYENTRFFHLIKEVTGSREVAGKKRLQFGSDGRFKIAQFTDMHFVDGSPHSAKTEATIRRVLEEEKPDVAILTGDQAIDKPSKDVWPRLARIFEEAQTPFAVVLGNHDAETITKDSIFDLLSRSPWFIGEKGPEDIYGVGNYVLDVRSRASDKTAALLYCLDSNDYPPSDTLSYYDWIHYDQIAWYRQQSRRYTQANNNSPLPALAFFHIPLLEYRHVAGRESTLGTKGEDVAPATINSGMFAAFVEMQDVKGVFVGHDHDNDYIGLEHGIALAYGRTTGADAYGTLERGARIIELQEDQPGCFHTWIRTPSGVEYLTSNINLQTR
jgi:alkaline phosphatase